MSQIVQTWEEIITGYVDPKAPNAFHTIGLKTISPDCESHAAAILLAKQNIKFIKKGLDAAELLNQLVQTQENLEESHPNLSKVELFDALRFEQEQVQNRQQWQQKHKVFEKQLEQFKQRRN